MPDSSEPRDPAFPLPHVLRPGEVVEGHAIANDSVIVVTRERLIVTEGPQPILDIPFGELRRIQFDIERGRDATLIIVPDHISNWPRVVSVPVSQLRETSTVLAQIGERINEAGEQRTG